MTTEELANKVGVSPQRIRVLRKRMASDGIAPSKAVTRKRGHPGPWDWPNEALRWLRARGIGSHR